MVEIKDGNGAVWAGFRPAPTHLYTRPKKTRLLPHPACFNGYSFNSTQPDSVSPAPKKPVYCPTPPASTDTRLTRPDPIQLCVCVKNTHTEAVFSQFHDERLSSQWRRFAIEALEKDREREAMPKKMGVNRKAEAARARKSATESERKERDAHEKEEMYWSVQIWASKVRNTSWTSISQRTWNQYQRMRIL